MKKKQSKRTYPKLHATLKVARLIDYLATELSDEHDAGIAFTTTVVADLLRTDAKARRLFDAALNRDRRQSGVNDEVFLYFEGKLLEVLLRSEVQDSRTGTSVNAKRPGSRGQP